MLFLLTPFFFRAYKAFTVDQVLRYAEVDREFYDTLLSLKVLVFQDADGNRTGGIYDRIATMSESNDSGPKSD
jgi:hypothetical protein